MGGGPELEDRILVLEHARTSAAGARGSCREASSAKFTKQYHQASGIPNACPAARAERLRSSELSAWFATVWEDQRRIPLQIATILSQQFGGMACNFSRSTKRLRTSPLARPRLSRHGIDPRLEWRQEHRRLYRHQAQMHSPPLDRGSVALTPACPCSRARRRPSRSTCGGGRTNSRANCAHRGFALAHPSGSMSSSLPTARWKPPKARAPAT
jgi:hypothetical protein